MIEKILIILMMMIMVVMRFGAIMVLLVRVKIMMMIIIAIHTCDNQVKYFFPFSVVNFVYVQIPRWYNRI